MSSPGRNIAYKSFTGAAAEITVPLPFKPKMVKFYATGGVWGIKVDGLPGMTLTNYLSNTAADTGVTINDDGSLTIASGADINVSGEEVYVEASE